MNERKLRATLRRTAPPSAVQARERARAIVLAAHEGARTPRRRGRLGLSVPVAVVLMTVAVGGAIAATPPGATVADWVRDVVGRDSAAPSPDRALTRVRGGGRLLVTGAGGAWVVSADGSRRRLGGYAVTTWSPRGLFVAAARGRQLVAMDPRGSVRWALARPAAIADPRWAPSGFRVAYRAGRQLRVVAGDGSGDQLLATAVRPVAPAWRAGPRNELAYVDGSGTIVRVDVDTHRVLGRLRPGLEPRRLEWSRDGRRLLVGGRAGLRLLRPAGGAVASLRGRDRTLLVDAALAPDGRRLALVRSSAVSDQHEVLVASPGADARLRTRGLFRSAGAVRSITWSPAGTFLLADWSGSDQWLFLAPGSSGRVHAVADVAAQFDPGRRPARHARVEGWCCR